MILKCKRDVLKVVYIERGAAGGISGSNGNLFERSLTDSGNDTALWTVMVYLKYWLLSWAGSCHTSDATGSVLQVPLPPKKLALQRKRFLEKNDSFQNEIENHR